MPRSPNKRTNSRVVRAPLVKNSTTMSVRKRLMSAQFSPRGSVDPFRQLQDEARALSPRGSSRAEYLREVNMAVDEEDLRVAMAKVGAKVQAYFPQKSGDETQARAAHRKRAPATFSFTDDTVMTGHLGYYG